MLHAVMYGAGNIGRGFIGQLLSQSGYEVVFLDINKPVIDRLNLDKGYPLRFVSKDTASEIFIPNVRGVSSQNQAAAAVEIAAADLMATAVGANILPYIAPVIAQGLVLRWQTGNQNPLNILICENLMDAQTVLKQLILEHMDSKYQPVFDERVGLVEASIGRMVPVATEIMQEGNPTRVWAEPYDELPVDREGFRGKIPNITGMKPYTPFRFYIERKLYLHNMTHAVLAYLGNRLGFEFIWQAVRSPDVANTAFSALSEAAQALSLRYNIPLSELMTFGQDLMERFDNRLLGDTTVRVCRDPIRKLAPNDRLIGAARLCLAQNIQPLHICQGIAAALRFQSDDDPAARELHAFLEASGPEAALVRYASLSKDDPLLSIVLSNM